jgi:DNA-binding transcriptional MerR regulator
MTTEFDLHLISAAAQLLDMHPQTLRKYERLGLIHPNRTLGSMRVYDGIQGLLRHARSDQDRKRR